MFKICDDIDIEMSVAAPAQNKWNEKKKLR